MMTGRVLRYVAAFALLVGGLIHLQLYFKAYRSYPDANLGRSFLVNAVASALVAAAVAIRGEWWVRASGVVVAAGTLVAFAVTRSSDTLFGFQEKGLEPSPQALLSLIVEILVIVLLGASFLFRSNSEAQAQKITMAAVGSVSGLVMLGFGLYWAHDYGRSTSVQTAPPATIVVSSSTTSTSVATSTSTSAQTATSLAPVRTTSQPPGTTTPATSAAATIAPATISPATISPATQPPTSTGAAEQPTTTTAAPAAAANAVSIVDFAFDNGTMTVPRGTTITWTNRDPFDHSVVGAADSFRSETLVSSSSFAHTFDQAGEFAYICGIHPSMSGTITVTG